MRTRARRTTGVRLALFWQITRIVIQMNPFYIRGFTLRKGDSLEKALRMLAKKHNDGNDGK